MAEVISAPEKAPGCIGFVFYSLGAAIPAVIILVAVSMFTMGGEDSNSSSNLRVNIGGTILCIVAAVLVFNAFRARRSGRELKGGEALVLYGSPGLALALLVPTIGGWAAMPTNEPAPAPVETVAPPCDDAPELVAAVDLVMGAKSDPASAQVYGQPDGRSNNLMEVLDRRDLAAMQNPKGAGVIVSVTYPGDGVFAAKTAHRTGWLVLDGSLYPINVAASTAFGMLWDGYPEDVKQQVGLGSDYFDMDSYGLGDFVSYNADNMNEYYAFVNEANQLCEPPTPWG